MKKLKYSVFLHRRLYLFSLFIIVFLLLTTCSQRYVYDEKKIDNESKETTEEQTTGTVTDIDGNVYETIIIGNQEWMVTNLKVTKYRNGDAIPNVREVSAWTSLSSGAYCVYENTESNADTYGFLYNWFAVVDSRDLAPEGWHVPTDDDWKELEMYLGMSQSEADDTGGRGTNEGGKLKETGTAHWLTPNTGTTNKSGFSALHGGSRDATNGSFGNMGQCADFWSSSESSSDGAWGRRLISSSAGISRSSMYKKNGFSVRCVRDK
ncbi:fibrobacter succinogenes major paralogous domain-containing protein [candidate division KSB1 bacterium]